MKASAMSMTSNGIESEVLFSDKIMDSIHVLPDLANESMAVPTQERSYTPQFSADATLILNRMKCKYAVSASQSPIVPDIAPKTDGEVLDDASPRQAQSLGETLPMPPHEGQRSMSAAASLDAAESFIKGLKRKRDERHEMVDFTQSTISFPMPSPVQAKASVPLPAIAPPLEPQTTVRQDNTEGKCIKCGDSTILSQNLLIACSKCSRSWHQKCMTPIMTDEAVLTCILVCAACSKLEAKEGPIHSANPQRQKEVERLREGNLALLPAGVVPAKAELVGFTAGQASDAALTEYFYGKQKTEMLNVLSFCDQLKPQLLVDILVSVSKRHPDLPIFESPDWNSQALQQPAVKSKYSHTIKTGKPRHGHTLMDPKMKLKKKFSKKILKIAPVASENEAFVEKVIDTLPPTWPKAGTGLYAKLLPEIEDRMFLLDENDEEAFSHFVVDKFGKQIAIPLMA